MSLHVLANGSCTVPHKWRWGWDALGYYHSCTSSYIIDFDITCSCLRRYVRRTFGVGGGVGWGINVHVHVHLCSYIIDFHNTCSYLRRYIRDTLGDSRECCFETQGPRRPAEEDRHGFATADELRRASKNGFSPIAPFWTRKRCKGVRTQKQS